MAGTSLVAGDVVVDALPYFDQGYDAPGVREAVSTVFTLIVPSCGEAGDVTRSYMPGFSCVC